MNSVDLVSPIDGSPMPQCPQASTSDVESAVAAAHLAQPEWAARPFAERYAAVERACRAMLEDRASVLPLVKQEMGKHETEGFFLEAFGSMEAVTSWRRVIEPKITHAVRLNPIAFPGKRARWELVPRGVIGIIAPWNFPVSGLYRSVLPAILTGNAVILKPSEYTPKSSSWFTGHLAKELPQGVVQTVTGDGAVGAKLIDAGIDACVFTGSPNTGAKVRLRCAELGIYASAEMGGKDGAIVLSDCDLGRTAAGVTQWALSNSGQSCGAIEIAYVEAKIADAFVERLKGAWEKLRTGPGPEDVEIHPIANARQLAIIEAHVADAVAKGAKVVTGGRRTGVGLGYLPTLLDNCNDTMDVVREETFGPVLAVVRFAGVDEAVRGINTSKYGLGASIWTSDIPRAERLATRLNVGVVDINNHGFTGAVFALPWSGTRATGFGVANSEWALMTFCRPKTVVVDTGSGPEPVWMPFDSTLRELGEALAEAQLGRVLRAWKVPLLLRRRAQRIRAMFW